MYPLNVTLTGPQMGYAVANDEAEHAALSALGYEPKLRVETVQYNAAAEKQVERLNELNEAVNGPSDDVVALRKQLEDAGVKYDKRWGIDKLKAALAG